MLGGARVTDAVLQHAREMLGVSPADTPAAAAPAAAAAAGV
jgi:hypothetical protein